MIPRFNTYHSAVSRRSFQAVTLTLIGILAFCTAAWAVSVVWTRTVNGSADGYDVGRDVVLAPNGDLYAVGGISVTSQSRNIWIRKYSPTGVKLWTRNVNGPANDYDTAHDAATDGNGNLYVVGLIRDDVEDDNIWIRKYSSSGIKRWTRNVDGPDHGSDAAYGAAVDAAGNLYVVGLIDVPGEDDNIWIRKYSSSGAKLWTRTVNGPANGYDHAYGAAADASGNLFVVGCVSTSTSGKDIWVRKYSSSGSRLWTRTVDGGADGQDCAYGVAVDAGNNVFVVGETTLDDPWPKIWIRKYSSSGTKLWTRIAARTAYQAEARDATVDENGAVYVIGSVIPDSGPTYSWIRKYSASGVKRWTAKYAGPDDDASGEGIVVNAAKRVYATGAVYKTGEGDNIWVRKYAP